MPTKYYTRTWCNSCKECTLHHKPFEKEFQCKECGDESKTFNLSDIPKDKYIEQIKRWEDSQGNKLGRIYSTFMSPSNNFFNEESEVIITEDDLGYKKHKAEFYAKEAEERKAKIEERNKLKDLYKGLTRNDKCGCGSGLKFKNCCLPKINEIIYE